VCCTNPRCSQYTLNFIRNLFGLRIAITNSSLLTGLSQGRKQNSCRIVTLSLALMSTAQITWQPEALWLFGAQVRKVTSHPSKSANHTSGNHESAVHPHGVVSVRDPGLEAVGCGLPKAGKELIAFSSSCFQYHTTLLCFSMLLGYRGER
jgi:hypothetical protein